VVNINNIHNNYGGLDPLRQGPRSISNIDRAASDERVRGGISSMESNRFGNGRVSMQQSRIDPGTFRKASVMTGASPITPSRTSFNSTDRGANPRSIPSRTISNQRFFSNARQNGFAQAGNGGENLNRSGNAPGNANGAFGNGQTTRPLQSTNQGQRGLPPPTPQQGQSIQSSRPGWRTFTPPSGQPTQSNRGRTFEGQNGPQQRPNYPQSSARSATPQSPYSSRDSYGGNASSRQTLNMQQPVVAPRGRGSYGDRAMPSAPSYPGYGAARGGPSGGGSYYGGQVPRGSGTYNGRAMPSAPNGPSYGPPRGGPSSGGSYSRGQAPVAPSGSYRGAPSNGGSRGGGSSGGGSHGSSAGSGHSSHH